MLPVEPKSFVEHYLEGKERPSKEQVVASRKSRFSKPALPAITERQSAKKPCACQGKCATKNAVVGVGVWGAYPVVREFAYFYSLGDFKKICNIFYKSKI